MAEQGTVDIDLAAMATLVGETVEDIITVCGSANINPNSFFRSRPIRPDASSKEVVFDSQVEYSLGDFRRYDHVAVTPAMFPSTITLNPDLATAIFQRPTAESLNIEELVGDAISGYWCAAYYTSSANRATHSAWTDRNVLSTDPDSQVAAQVQFFSETPPVDHTNDQTNRPVAGDQYMWDRGFNIAGQSDGTTTYSELYIGDSSGNVFFYMPNGEWNNTITWDTAPGTGGSTPYVDQFGQGQSGLGGYTVVVPIVNNSSSSCLSEDVQHYVGSSSVDFWVHMTGVDTGVSYRLGVIAYGCKLALNGTDHDLGDITFSSGATNINVTSTDMFGSDDIWEDESDVATFKFTSLGTITEGAVCEPQP